MQLRDMLVFPTGNTSACQYAVQALKDAGISTIDHPSPDITHLLFDVPSFANNGELRCGGDLESVLERLPHTITVIGGNLDHPKLQGYQTIDLLKDEHYLSANAAITADCALQVAASLMTTTFADTPVLIIGWGRIGKCLGQLLKNIGCQVTIAARKETDRAMIQALGFPSVEISMIPALLPHVRLLFNTAPEPILHKEVLAPWRNCIKIDLASQPGMEGDDVICARGLPGVYAPESSGQLIANTVLRRYREDS